MEDDSPQCTILTGIQASGKSTFCRERFFRTHVRINLDMLRTRSRELQFLEACLRTQQSFVVDNTNPCRKDRSRYINLAKPHGFQIIGYYFQSRIEDAIRRNAARLGTERIPEVAIRGTHARLEVPSFDEGFDALFYVRTNEGFAVEEWNDMSARSSMDRVLVS